MKILVTGHKGFIGSNLYWTLRSIGEDVDGYDLGDKLRNNKYDCVVHCAANLYEKFNDNVKLTKKLTKKFTNSHFIFTSSAAVYGDSNNAKETDELNPYGEYGRSKLKEEQLIAKLKSYTIFRLSNVYGYNSDHGVYSRLINENSPINYPEHIRDFVSVDEVIDGILFSITKPYYWQGIFNLSSGVGVTMQKLHSILRPFDKMISINSDLKEISYSVLDNSKYRINKLITKKL